MGDSDLYEAAQVALLFLLRHMKVQFTKEMLQAQAKRAKYLGAVIPLSPHSMTSEDTTDVLSQVRGEGSNQGQRRMQGGGRLFQMCVGKCVSPPLHDLAAIPLSNQYDRVSATETQYVQEVLRVLPIQFFGTNESLHDSRSGGAVARLGNTVFVEARDANFIEDIKVLKGLPYGRLIGTLVHELLHCYIYLYRVKEHTIHLHKMHCHGTEGGAMEEGLCHASAILFWKLYSERRLTISARTGDWTDLRIMESTTKKWGTNTRNGRYKMEIAAFMQAFKKNSGRSVVQRFASHNQF